MKNFYKVLFLLLIIVTLFSCPNKPADTIIVPVKTQYTIKFYVWNDTENKYVEIPQTVDDGDIFGDIIKPETTSFNKDGKTYTFSGWVERTSPPSGILTEGNIIDDTTEIKENKCYYAKYKSEIIQHTIIFNVWDNIKNEYKEHHINVAHECVFNSIVKPEAKMFDKDEKTYNFLGWVEKTTSPSNILTNGDIVDNNIIISENKTFYARYEIGDLSDYHKVTFKIFDKLSQEYIYKTSNFIDKEIIIDTKLSDIINENQIDDVIIGGTKYSFYGWADVSSSDEIIEEFQVEKIVDNNTLITESKTYCAIYKGDYLTFRAKEKGYVKINISGTIPNAISLQYRKEGEKEFKDYTWEGNISARTGDGFKIELNANEKVYFKGNNSYFSRSSSNYIYFDTDFLGKKIEASGSVMTLVNFREKIPHDYFFYRLFSRCEGLLTAPELPATTLAPHCYEDMFKGCELLITAPELPATTLASYCYFGMFYGCILLTAPELPATILARNCYKVMFEGCTSLIEAPELPATTLANSCYWSMFKGCTSLTEAPVLSAETLVESCYSIMFYGCKSLINAPELPARTLANNCYQSMFIGCTSLTEAPELPATTLAENCYRNMFSGCTSLTSITCLATDISASDCLGSWVSEVASLGAFKCKEGVNWTKDSSSGIPEGWTVKYV